MAVLSHSEPTHALEKKVKSMSMDKLQMERLMAKFYCVSCFFFYSSGHWKVIRKLLESGLRTLIEAIFVVATTCCQ